MSNHPRIGRGSWVLAVVLALTAAGGWAVPTSNVIKTFLVDRNSLPDSTNIENSAANWPYESFIWGLAQLDGNATARLNVIQPMRPEERMPRRPLHPGYQVHVWVYMATDPVNLQPGETDMGARRFKYYPPRFKPYAVSYENLRTVAVEADGSPQTNPENYGNRALEPEKVEVGTPPSREFVLADTAASPIPLLKTIPAPGAAPWQASDSWVIGDHKAPFDGQVDSPGDVGIGTIEVQYEVHDGTNQYWKSYEPPITVRFMVSRLDVFPQFAEAPASATDPLTDPNTHLLAVDPYPQPLPPKMSASNPLARVLTPPVFLIGYVRDNNQVVGGGAPRTEPYWFAYAPGAKSPDKDLQIKNRGTAFPGNSFVRFEIDQHFQATNRWGTFLLPMSPANFKGPPTLRAGETIPYTVSALVPTFQPPTEDSIRQQDEGNSTTPTAPGERYTGQARVFLDRTVLPNLWSNRYDGNNNALTSPSKVNNQWDCHFYELEVSSTANPDDTYDQFDALIYEYDPAGASAVMHGDGDALLVEEYDTFEVQVSVRVDRDLSMRETTLDLGPVRQGAGSRRVLFTPTNDGNVQLNAVKIQWADLFRSDVDNMWTSWPRRMQALALNRSNLYAWGIPNTGATLPTAETGSLAGWTLPVSMQAGIWDANYNLFWKVPVGQGAGTYAGAFTLYEDLNGNNVPDFLDVNGNGTQDSGEPNEPQHGFSVAAQVVESPLGRVDGMVQTTSGVQPWITYFNSRVAADVLPAVVFGGDPNGNHPNEWLWVSWATNRRLAQNGNEEVDANGHFVPPQPTDPWHIFHAWARGNDPAADGDPNYRTWHWQGFQPAYQEISSEVRNLYPSVARDPQGKYWIFWYREGKSVDHYVSELMYYQAGAGGNITPLTVSATTFSKQKPRAVVTREGNQPVFWLFWNGGTQGNSHLYFNRFTESNGVAYDGYTGATAVQDYRLNTCRALKYVKDAAPLPMFDPATGSLSHLSLFYTGLSEVWGNEDIYWSAFDPGATALSPLLLDGHPFYTTDANGVRVAHFPYGKRPFPRVQERLIETTDALGEVFVCDPSGAPTPSRPGERLTSNDTHTLYKARNPDWYMTPPEAWLYTTAVNPLTGRYATLNTQPLLGYPREGIFDDPVVYVARMGTDPNTGATDRYQQGPQWHLRAWPLIGPKDPNGDPDPRYNFFDTQRSEAVLLVADPDFLAPWDRNGSNRVEPNEEALATTQGLWVKINPARGTVEFSRALYGFDDRDGDHFQDPGEPVFTGEAMSPHVIEVFANYTTATRRVTEHLANDSEPAAVVDDFNRVFVAWRRTENNQRTTLWYKTISSAIQVNRPPYEVGTWSYQGFGGDTLVGAPAVGQTGVNNEGLIWFDEVDEGQRVQVDYNGYAGVDANGNILYAPVSEVHLIRGFNRSEEQPIPMETVANESQVAVAPEVFPVYYDPADANKFIRSVRFWVFWTSTRDFFDPNEPSYDPNPGTPEKDPYRSGDIYFQALVPTWPTGAPL